MMRCASFLGSGTTAQAARAEGFQCVGIEREGTYLPLIRARLDAGDSGDLFGGPDVSRTERVELLKPSRAAAEGQS